MQNKTQVEKVRTGVKASGVILPLLGITWLFGLLSFNSDTIIFKYIFTIFNSLQGLMIFIFHCILNKQVIQVCLFVCLFFLVCISLCFIYSFSFSSETSNFRLLFLSAFSIVNRCWPALSLFHYLCFIFKSMIPLVVVIFLIK